MPSDLTSQLAHLAGTSREIPRGSVLFHEGEVGRTLFVVRSGRLRAVRPDGEGGLRLVGEIGPGELCGELAVLCDAPRSATVVAVRDSVVTEISGEDLTRLPAATLLETMRVLAARMRGMIGGAPSHPPPRCLVLVPATPDLPLASFAGALDGAARRLGRRCHLLTAALLPAEFRDLTAEKAGRLSAWLSEQEAPDTTVLLATDHAATEWTRRCLLQADLVMIVGEGGGDPTPSPAERALSSVGNAYTRPEVDLVLLQREQPYRGTGAWLEGRHPGRHFHVRPGVMADVDRLARQLFAENLNLALGGGGARGFAHVGVVQACEELGLPIDQVGGTSIGAIVGALVAMGLPAAEIRARLREAMVPARKLRQWTLPVISLDSSRGYIHALQTLYGSAEIEDLPLNFFCISCNLTLGRSEVHRRGPLWKWVSASISYPLLGAPLVRNGEMLVDGGLLNNVPVDIAREDGAGFVLGVDVGASDAFRLPSSYNGRPGAWEVLRSRLRRARPGGDDGPPVFPTLIDLISRTCMLSSMVEGERIRQQADLYLRMPVDHYRLLDFDLIDEIAARGHQAALAGLAPAVAWQQRRTAASPDRPPLTP